VDATGSEAVRAEVSSWLHENWDPQRPLLEWRTLLADSGWACPSWPRAWFGRGLAPALDAVVADEIARSGAVGPPLGSGLSLAAPTILEHGPDDLRARLLRRIVTGEDTWCQLFSEPGSGSDLAGLSTRAERDGDEWVVNGQKVWTTSAHRAERGMLLARTDLDVPKHQGITYFALPMRQPGVDVRPLRQMNGHSSFNEVFLTDVRVSDADIIGRPGGGWAAALTTLTHERRFAGLRPPNFDRVAGGRTRREAAAEAEAHFSPYVWYPQRSGRADVVAGLAGTVGRASDPVARQRIAGLVGLLRANSWTDQRARDVRAAGRPPGPEGSLGKLASSNVARAAAGVHSLLAGAHGMETGPGSLLGGVVAEVLVSVPAVSIAGGTDEIQRNIIGERVLGLPREARVDVDVPYREVPRNPGGPAPR
jgi:alkylation response protein AidB-like acyl-CoA dehydrogenase